jgi:hypothetical protein
MINREGLMMRGYIVGAGSARLAAKREMGGGSEE